MPKLIDDTNVVLFCSYPKSGNTWLKLFFSLLNKLKSGNNETFNIREYEKFFPYVSFSDKKWLQASTDIDVNECDFNQTNELRSQALKKLCFDNESTHFVKGHDYCFNLSDNKRLFQDNPSMKVIYIVRNPLDIAVSLSHFADLDLNTSVEFLTSDYAYIPHDKDKEVLQKLQSWSNHVKSWLAVPFENFLFIKYEDMLHQSYDTFKKICDFINVPVSKSELNYLLENSSFDAFNSAEKKYGFHERVVEHRNFFHKGQTDQWREKLTQEQVDIIYSQHKEVMNQLGYACKPEGTSTMEPS